ncbi:MAG TPA: PqqD family protein [Mucilaginibacter sp.]
MENLILPKTVKISNNVLFQHINNECVLLDMDSEQYYGLDDIGARMWQLLSEDGDTGKALTLLLAEYDIDEKTLRQDLFNLITELGNVKLISVEN